MLTLLVSILHAAAPAPAGAVPAPSRLITAPALRGHVGFLASDLTQGRAPGTPGEQLTHAYLAATFETLGLTPAGDDGGFVQRVPMVGVSGAPAKAVVELPGKRALELDVDDEVVLVAGRPEARSAVDRAELVFVGYGMVAPEYGWDDYQGVDVKGKIAVVLNSDPDADPALFGGKARLWYGRWDYKYVEAQRHGAAGCLIIHTTASAGYPWQVVQTSWAGEQLDLEPSASDMDVKGWVTEAAARRLFSAAGQSLDAQVAAAQRRTFRALPLGARLSAAWDNTVVKRSSGNVLALLPGRDPKVADELVVLTAHHDHLGMSAAASPRADAIFNGAVDNASGVAALLTVARALTSGAEAPRRSVLFASVTGEEQGLLGSAWLVSHLGGPAGKVAANINIDGLNIWGRTRDVTVIGLGKSSLDGLITTLARAQGRVVRADGMADRGFFYRSDQFSFARAGIPAAYFSSGQDFVNRPPGWGKAQRELWESAHYHQVSDELTPAWDLSGAVEDVQLYYQLTLVVANGEAAPAWTKGDEFEQVRRKAGG